MKIRDVPCAVKLVEVADILEVRERARDARKQATERTGFLFSQRMKRTNLHKSCRIQVRQVCAWCTLVQHLRDRGCECFDPCRYLIVRVARIGAGAIFKRIVSLGSMSECDNDGYTRRTELKRTTERTGLNFFLLAAAKPSFKRSISVLMPETQCG